MLSKCCQWWCGRCRVCLRLHNCRNVQFIRTILHNSLAEVVGHVTPSWWCQFVKPYLLLSKALYALLYHVGDCVHHPASFVIFAQLVNLCIFLIIIAVIPFLLILGSFKIPQTVSDSVHHLLKCCFRLCGCWSCLFHHFSYVPTLA